MPIIPCSLCNKSFYRKPSQILLAEKHYCSDVCRYEGKKTGKIISCFECSKDVYKPLRDLQRSKSNKNFCSIACSNKWHGKEYSRENHPNWTNGEFSYREVMKRHSDLKQCVSCKTFDKRVLAVHHIDKNRKNNNLKNLIWLCHNCHFLKHHYEK